MMSQNGSIDMYDREKTRVVRLSAIIFAFVASASASQIATARPPLLDEKRNVLTVAPIIEQTAPAVVNISVRSRVPGSENPLFRDPFFAATLACPTRRRNRRP
jgi:S1-C subfamily serine protease